VFQNLVRLLNFYQNIFIDCLNFRCEFINLFLFLMNVYFQHHEIFIEEFYLWFVFKTNFIKYYQNFAIYFDFISLFLEKFTVLNLRIFYLLFHFKKLFKNEEMDYQVICFSLYFISLTWVIYFDLNFKIHFQLRN